MGASIDRFVTNLLKPINVDASIIMGVFTSMWGAWLLLPVQSFDSADLYSKMERFAPEWAWGSWALICGLLITWTLMKKSYKALSQAMLFGLWHWATVSGMMWWGDWKNTGGLTYTFIAIYVWFIYINVHINHVVLPDEMKNKRKILRHNNR